MDLTSSSRLTLRDFCLSRIRVSALLHRTSSVYAGWLLARIARVPALRCLAMTGRAQNLATSDNLKKKYGKSKKRQLAKTKIVELTGRIAKQPPLMKILTAKTPLSATLRNTLCSLEKGGFRLSHQLYHTNAFAKTSSVSVRTYYGVSQPSYGL